MSSVQAVAKACTFGTSIEGTAAAVLDELTYWCAAIVREEPVDGGDTDRNLRVAVLSPR